MLGRVCRGTCASEGAFVIPLAGLLFLPRLPPPKLDKESSSGPTGVDCGLLDAMPNSLTATTKQVLLKRSLEPRSATTRNFETSTTQLETPSCKLTSTKLFQSANRNLTKTWQRLALTTKAKLCTRTSFLSVLSQSAVAQTSCRLSLLLSVKLEAFSRLDCSLTKGCAGKLSSKTKLRTWTPLRGLRHIFSVLFPHSSTSELSFTEWVSSLSSNPQTTQAGSPLNFQT